MSKISNWQAFLRGSQYRALMNVHLEEAYYGEVLGDRSLYQLSSYDHQQQCLSQNSSAGDGTGLRVYHGSHVAVRFLAKHSELLNNQRVIELGCGVGVLGLLGTSQAHPTLLVLTDGSSRVQSILEQNIELDGAIRCPETTVLARLLRWGDQDDTKGVLDLCRNRDSSSGTTGEPDSSRAYYDVVIGCELMYNSTDIDLLVNTVLTLTNSVGLFLHAHFFRARDQENQLIAILGKHNWTTLEIPCTEFISPLELQQHPDWRQIRTLISGPRERIAAMAQEHPTWMEFKEEITYQYDESDEENSEGINLFS